ncbi:MAG: tryptophanase [Bdellovibrio sp.]|nr:tryptophanase [Bdellovibrio sp.]
MQDFEFKTIIEPFRIKMVEPLSRLSLKEREEWLGRAHYNLFLIPAEAILIDLLTDSGTGAMSSKQWAGMIDGDESYAGARSFFAFEREVKGLTSHAFIFPTHQGRAAERILFTIIGKKGKYILNNNHFDTTRANIEYTGAEAVDLVIEEGKNPRSEHPFKGNMDLDKLKDFIKQKGVENIPMVLMTVTNNSGGGQPVSLENIKQVSKICRTHKIPFFLDACRFAENAYFIKKREPGQAHRTIKDIVCEVFSYTDGSLMSAKKDAMVNIGGWLTLNDPELAAHVKNLGILTEGFPTYGGLAGRDLEAIAQGLREVVEEDYLQYRIASMEYLGRHLVKHDIPILTPVGGHAVYLDAKAMLPHIPTHQFPGQALATELYRVGGLRSVEIGSFMFPQNAKMELVRLAIPRRVYTQSHIDYVGEVIVKVNEMKKQMRGFRIVEEPPFLRHFSAKLERV